MQKTVLVAQSFAWMMDLAYRVPHDACFRPECHGEQPSLNRFVLPGRFRPFLLFQESQGANFELSPQLE